LPIKKEAISVQRVGTQGRFGPPSLGALDDVVLVGKAATFTAQRTIRNSATFTARDIERGALKVSREKYFEISKASEGGIEARKPT
jgi:hypothetical protein